MKEEMLDVVDDDDKVVRNATRKEVESKLLLHRDSKVIVFDKFGKIFVQKRSRTKSRYPLYWDIGIYETVKSGESYENAAIRGLKEEFGIGNAKINFLFKMRNDSKESKDFCSVYEMEYDGEINFQKNEIESIGSLTPSEVKSLIEKEKFHPAGKTAFEKYMDYVKTRKC